VINKIDSYLSKELAPVYADIALIERVIQNLLDNAIKFTGKWTYHFNY
jgi:signal transduction histidine kinase